MNTSMATRTDDETLRKGLERMIPTILDEPSMITDISWSRFKLSTSYDTYIVKVQLAAGDEFKFFLKDFGFSVRPKDSPKQRRERELRIYQDLLAEADLGTARYYGSILDESQGQCSHWSLWKARPPATVSLNTGRPRLARSGGCTDTLPGTVTVCVRVIT
jgi:hypothetical protein